jgi:cytochrome c peroxidase
MRRHPWTALAVVAALLVLAACASCASGAGGSGSAAEPPAWEQANPVLPLPAPPLGINATFAELPEPPTPARVRLGRWLFYDTRLSADDSISCATCHRPEHAFSEPMPVSTGIHGQQGKRKAPSFVNLAWTIYPHFFWDGRADSLEAQAKGPIVNPIEMGMNNHDVMIVKLGAIEAYAPYFTEAFGDPAITVDRVAKAIADYERTRMSGNSPYDRWRAGDESAVSEEVKLGHELFFGKAACNQCHFGDNFTDSSFHNLGVGWDRARNEMADLGRYEISKAEEDRGAFKTPGLREVSLHAPYMHDGSIATLREVVVHYDIGGVPNPWLSPKIDKLGLSAAEIDALVAMMEALEGEGYRDTAPAAFPQ